MQKAGISDLIGVYRGVFYAFEAKTPENKDGATRLQKIFIQKVIKAGGRGFVISSLDEVKEIINNHHDV